MTFDPRTTNIVLACIRTTVIVGGTPDAETAMRINGTVSIAAITMILFCGNSVIPSWISGFQKHCTFVRPTNVNAENRNMI
jgi:hypothetical protein